MEASTCQMATMLRLAKLCKELYHHIGIRYGKPETVNFWSAITFEKNLMMRSMVGGLSVEKHMELLSDSFRGLHDLALDLELKFEPAMIERVREMRNLIPN